MDEIRERSTVVNFVGTNWPTVRYVAGKVAGTGNTTLRSTLNVRPVERPASPPGDFRSHDLQRRTKGFRIGLRDATLTEHGATEELFAPFLNAPDDRLYWYLGAQRAALAAISRQPQGADEPGSAKPGSDAVIKDLIHRLDRDLAHAGRVVTSLQAGKTLHPRAIDYVVLGSRLGTEVIRRDIFRDRHSSEIPLYFQSPPRPDLWRGLCRALDQIDPNSDLARAITDDVRSGFELFSQAATLQKVTDD